MHRRAGTTMAPWRLYARSGPRAVEHVASHTQVCAPARVTHPPLLSGVAAACHVRKRPAPSDVSCGSSPVSKRRHSRRVAHKSMETHSGGGVLWASSMRQTCQGNKMARSGTTGIATRHPATSQGHPATSQEHTFLHLGQLTRPGVPLIS